MKNYALRLLASLTLATVSLLAAWGQAETDAFYVYQNDGHFNGFFYDEVQEIRYSKLDTLGFEHDDFVTQEVVTADSTYRIMLSAIDSVGFVQPQTIMNENLRGMDDLWEHLISRTDDKLIFDNTQMYWGQEPMVGQVLIDYSFDDGFAAKVKRVKKEGSTLVVETEPITSLNDVFRQFISVEELTYDPNGHYFIKRRVAGRPDLSEESFEEYCAKQRRVAGDVQGDIFNFSITGHIPLFEGKIDLQPSISSRLNVKTEWDIPMWGDSYIAVTSTLHTGISIGFTAGGEFKGKVNTGMGNATGIPIPASAPLFELVLVPDMFVKASASANVKLKLPTFRGRVWAKLEFKNLWPRVKVGSGLPPGQEEESEYTDFEEPLALSAEFSGSLQAGVQFPITLKTNKWLSKLLDCEVGTTMYLGPKFSGTLNFNLNSALLDDNSLYGNLKDTKLSIQPLAADYETVAKMESYFGKPKEVTLIDGSMSLMKDLDVYLFPAFKEFEKKDTVKYVWVNDENVEEPCEVLSFKPSRMLLYPVMCGLAVYRYDMKQKKEVLNETVPCQDAEYAPFSHDWLAGYKTKLWIYSSDILKAGPCTLKPYFTFSYGGKEIIATDTNFAYYAPGCYLTLNQTADTLTFTAEGGAETVNFVGAYDKLTAYINHADHSYERTVGETTEWTYEAPIPVTIGQNSVTFNMPPKGGVLKRYGYVHLKGTMDAAAAKGGPTIAFLDVPFVQEANGKIEKILVDVIGFKKDDGFYSSGFGQDEPYWFYVPLDCELDEFSTSWNGKELRITGTKTEGTGKGIVADPKVEYQVDLRFDLTEEGWKEFGNEGKQPHMTGGKYTIKATREWEEDNDNDTKDKYQIEFTYTLEMQESRYPNNKDGSIVTSSDYSMVYDSMQSGAGSVSADYVIKRNGTEIKHEVYGTDRFSSQGSSGASFLFFYK